MDDINLTMLANTSYVNNEEDYLKAKAQTFMMYKIGSFLFYSFNFHSVKSNESGPGIMSLLNSAHLTGLQTIGYIKHKGQILIF